MLTSQISKASSSHDVLSKSLIRNGVLTASTMQYKSDF